VLQTGDSHDPNDPYYKALQDSVLQAHGVASVEQLPFNYSGFQMKEGERISASIYNQHLFRLLQTYERQNDVFRLSAFVNPIAALRQFSMAISGTDFRAYVRFQQQAETYRYRLAQHMNELQIKLISSREEGDQEKPYRISNAYWKAFPDFTYATLRPGEVLRKEVFSLAALLFWAALLTATVFLLSGKLKAK
jgi:ABC-2 type transport system permease protein